MFGVYGQKITLTVDFGPAYTGLATIGYKLWNGDGTQYQARTTTNVAETVAGTGQYKVEVAANVFSAYFDGYVEWDVNSAAPYAVEDIHLIAPVATQTSVDTIATYVDTEVSAIKAKTDNLPSDPADASDIAASFASITTTLSTISSYIDTEVAAIKAKTDNLPPDPADASDIATSFASIAATLATIASYIDTEVGTIRGAE